MAEPLTTTGAVALLEESAQLLRQTSFATLLRHWIGSVPFALGLLMVWNNLATARMADSALAIQAGALALLLLWMNAWRAVFAGRLRRHLIGETGSRWTSTRVFRLVAVQSFAGALKLAILPLALLVLFPFANTVAFFRTVAALSDRSDLDVLQVLSRARDLARVHPGQSWGILPILLLLQIAIALNLAVSFAILPFLVRMLTGYESQFNLANAFFVDSPLFLVLVLVSSWLAFDPFVQAVYCVRAFHAESVETGADLRVALRRIRATGIVAAVLLFAIAPARGAPAVSPQELHDSVQKAMQAPEYGWRIPPPPGGIAAGRPWVLRVADKILDVLNSMWRAVGKAIGKLLEWLFGKSGAALKEGGGAAPAAGLHWSLWLLMAAVAGAAAWIAWRRRLLRRTRPATAAPLVAAVRVDQEGVTADQLPEERWMEMALECLRQENCRLALRAYYLAGLAWLGQRGFIAIHAGKTNREYELELRRKARQFADARGLFHANIGAFESSWYGMHEVTVEGVEAFRDRLEGIKRAMA